MPATRSSRPRDANATLPRDVVPTERRYLIAIIKCISLVVFSLAIYYPSLKGEFIWDDKDIYIIDNPLLRDPNGIYKFWFTNEPDDYYPLTYTTFWIEWQLVGTDTFLYRVNNALLHGFTGVVLFLLLSRLKIPFAFGIAAIFIAHPLQVESVAWISQRKTILSYFLAVCSMLAYVSVSGASRPRAVRVLSYILYALSLAAKPTMITLPVAVFAIEVLAKRSNLKAILISTAPMFAPSLIFGLVGLAYQQKLIGGVDVRDQDFITRFICQGWAVWFYIRQFFMVWTLSFVYPRWQVDSLSVLAWIPIVMVVMTTFGFYRYRTRFGYVPFMAWCYFLITMFPILGMSDVFFWRFSYVGDHYIYQSLVALPVLAVFVAHAAHPKIAGRLGGTVMLACVTLLAVVSHERSKVYLTQEGLWEETIQKNPNAALAWFNLGVSRESTAMVQKSLEIDPLLFGAWQYLADVEFKEERWVSALANYGKAAATAPTGSGFASRCIEKQVVCLVRLGRGREALKVLNEFLSAYNSGRLRALYLETLPLRFATLRVAAADVAGDQETLPIVNEELAALQSEPISHFIAGRIFEDCGALERAAIAYATYARLSPNDPAGLSAQGMVLLAVGDIPSAYNSLKTAVELGDQTADTLTHLGVASMMLGDHDRGLKAFRDAAAVEGSDFRIWSNLGRACLAKGLPLEAADAWRRAIELQPSDPETLRDLAALISTDPAFSNRDAFHDAISFATKACEFTEFKRLDCLDVLAAAFARAGDFPRACKVMEQAISVARATSATAEEIQRLETRCKEYRMNVPSSGAGR